MKKLLCLLLALGLVGVLAACAPKEDKPEDGGQTPAVDDVAAGASDLDYIREKGEMIIGYTLYEPMNYIGDDGALTGFDTELATMICEKLGVKPNFMEINWDTKDVALQAKSLDCVWNGLTIDPERAANMELTQPYVKNAQVVLMKDGAEYVDTASLADKTIVAEQTSAGEKTIKEDPNLKNASYIAKTKQSDCLIEIKAGTADAAILDLTLAKTMTGEGTNFADLKIVDRLAEENYGVAFRKGSDVAAEINKIFDELTADGSMAALAEKYGLDLAEKDS